MSTIKIEFPADRLDIARHFGVALKAMGNNIATPATDTTDASLRSDSKRILILDEVDAGSNENGGFNKEELEESANLGKLDLNGVAINAELCANAAKPFYASGKREGQWKKRQGVGDDEYEGWYADALAKITPKDDGGSTVDTSAAFSGQGADDGAAEPAIPHDAGSLMAWVAEMQSANRITQEMVTAAYTQASITMTDIFEGPGKTPDVIAGRVGELHNILNGWAQQ